MQKTISNAGINMLLFILMTALVWFSTSCDNDNGERNWPAEIDSVSADFISSSSATFKGDILGNLVEVKEMGFVWSESPSPTIDDQKMDTDVEIGFFSVDVQQSLLPGTLYHVRAYYLLENLVYYSKEISFVTPESVQDNAANQYGVVQVGDQLWMDQNLMVETYNNGDPIPDGTQLGNYNDEDQPHYFFFYEDENSNKPIYGLLYTWYVIVDDRGICPEGYRVPDILDWEKLVTHLDPLANKLDDLTPGNPELSPVAGGMLKKTGTIEEGNGLWYDPNGGANNRTRLGFIPAGLRDPTGTFSGKGLNAPHWSFTQQNEDNGIIFYTHYFNAGFFSNNFSKKSGYPVRCMKDVSVE